MNQASKAQQELINQLIKNQEILSAEIENVYGILFVTSCPECHPKIRSALRLWRSVRNVISFESIRSMRVNNG